MVFVQDAAEVVTDLHAVGALVQASVEAQVVEMISAQGLRIDAVARGRLVELHERVRVVPVTARDVAAIHHDHVAVVVRVDQCVDERHARCPRPNHQVVGLDRSHDATPLRALLVVNRAPARFWMDDNSGLRTRRLARGVCTTSASVVLAVACEQCGALNVNPRSVACGRRNSSNMLFAVTNVQVREWSTVVAVSRTTRRDPPRWLAKETKAHRRAWWRKNRHRARLQPNTAAPRRTEGWLTW